MHPSLFICSPWEGNVGAFPLWVVANEVAVNICAQVFVGLYIFISPRETPRIGTARSHSNSMFNFIRNCQDIFQSVYPVWPFYQQWATVLVPWVRPSTPGTVAIFAILMKVLWHLTLVFICFSLVFEWTPGVGDGQGGLACCYSWGHKESDTTERLMSG